MGKTDSLQSVSPDCPSLLLITQYIEAFSPSASRCLWGPRTLSDVRVPFPDKRNVGGLPPPIASFVGISHAASAITASEMTVSRAKICGAATLEKVITDRSNYITTSRSATRRISGANPGRRAISV